MIGAPLLIFTLACAVCAMQALAASGTRRPARVGDDDLTGRIDALLPQTQCGLCGYSGCRPYADALARDAADIDRCPPGGQQTVHALATLLGRPAATRHSAAAAARPQVAVIDEDACIGCWKCVRACPVDAIIGAPKHMHTVIPAFCTGCGLCVPPCPVDCIDLLPAEFDGPRAAQLAHIAAPEPRT